MLTRTEALNRWRKFADLERTAPRCQHADFEPDWQAFAARFAAATDRAELRRFGLETRHLPWPERSGEIAMGVCPIGQQRADQRRGGGAAAVASPAVLARRASRAGQAAGAALVAAVAPMSRSRARARLGVAGPRAPKTPDAETMLRWRERHDMTQEQAADELGSRPIMSRRSSAAGSG